MIKFILGFILGYFAKKLWRIAWTWIKKILSRQK